jgi:phosphonate transport system substrate-binding protein
MKLSRIWFILLLLNLATIAFAAGNKDIKPLRVGMLPSLSLQKLFERFTPLQDYLKQTLHRPVILLTATNYETYLKRAGEYEYDLYFAAPHMAAYVESEFGYRRISLMTRDLGGYLLVRTGGPIKKVSDLKGRVVSAPERLAIITMMGEVLLEQNNLTPGKDVKIDYTSTHNNAILALSGGKADAAIASTAIFDIVKSELRNKLTILKKTENVSHLMFMASPKLPEKEYTQLREAMLRFKADGPGKEFFKRSPYGDMAEIHDEDMRNMQPYIKMLKQGLSGKE